MTPRHVILIGLRGSGKTTVGSLLAARTNRGFVDLDTLTPAALGCATVSEAWSNLGEPAFRRAETECLRAALNELTGRVLALGGGTPTAPGAAEALALAKASGSRVIYLHASPAQLAARLQGADNSHRPSLTGLSPTSVEEISRIYSQRDALYRALADAVVEVGGCTTRQATDAVQDAA